MIIVGTSGYSFQDWKRHFYPEDIKNHEMLDFYARHFNAVEINSTYYRMPETLMFDRMLEKTPENFEFVVKANKAMTHERKSNATVFDQFNEGIRPLINAKRFSGLLAQFPWSFKNTQSNRAYLAQFKDKMGDNPLIVEFRHNSWIIEPVFDLLRRLDISYCAVDEPRLNGLVPPVAIATNNLGYVRFHGRNAESWWDGDASKRYDYLYTQQELFDWLPKIETIEKSTDKTFVFFNNCHNGQAATNAQMMLSFMNNPS